KRLPRLLIPLAVWLPLYYPYFWIKGADVAEYALHLFWAKGYFHLWFLPPLLGLYLVTPLLRRVIERVSRSRDLTLIAVGLLLLEVIGSLFLFVYQVELPIPILFIPYLGYYLLGYVLKEHALAKKSLWGVLYGTSTLAMITLLILYHGTSWAEYVTSNLSPLVAVATISLFALFSSLPRLSHNPRFLSSFAARSLGVYLIHIVVLDVVTKPFLLWFPWIMEQALLSILLRWSLTALLSFIGVSLLYKVRPLRPFL
uniref:acyltransferase n=1 Tax=Porphyromonas endodontalis TaxID=28124 RepID=UPI0026EC0493